MTLNSVVVIVRKKLSVDWQFKETKQWSLMFEDPISLWLSTCFNVQKTHYLTLTVDHCSRSLSDAPFHPPEKPSVLWLVGSDRPEEAPPSMFPHQHCWCFCNLGCAWMVVDGADCVFFDISTSLQFRRLIWKQFLNIGCQFLSIYMATTSALYSKRQGTMTFYNMKPEVLLAHASTATSAHVLHRSITTSASSFSPGFFLVMIHKTKTVTLTCREK